MVHCLDCWEARASCGTARIELPLSVVVVLVRCLQNVTLLRPAGVQVVDIETVMSEIDIFVSSTGNFNIISLAHIKRWNSNAFVGDTGHLDTRSTWLAQRADC